MNKLTGYKITWDFTGHVKGGSKTPGIDFATPSNTPLYPLFSGIVKFVGEDQSSINPSDGSKAKYIMIGTLNGDEFYVHLNRIDVKVGQKVSVSTQIGLSGNSGNSTGPHTHYGIRYNGKYINPEPLIFNNNNMTEEQYEEIIRRLGRIETRAEDVRNIQNVDLARQDEGFNLLTEMIKELSKIQSSGYSLTEDEKLVLKQAGDIIKKYT